MEPERGYLADLEEWMGPVLVAALAACTPDPTTVLSGTVYEDRDPQAGPLGGADVLVVDQDTVELGSGVTEGDGSFEIVVPSATNVFLEIAADGFAPTVFSGVIGLEERLEVDIRLFPHDPAAIDALREEFAGCPGADAEGGIVVGEVRLDDVVDPETGEQLTVTTGTAAVTALDGTTLEACYRDFDGLAYDPDALRTGLSGFFVVFGVPPGRHDLDVMYEYIEGAFVQQFYPVWIPDDGAISPWYPASVPFVF